MKIFCVTVLGTAFIFLSPVSSNAQTNNQDFFNTLSQGLGSIARDLNKKPRCLDEYDDECEDANGNYRYEGESPYDLRKEREKQNRRNQNNRGSSNSGSQKFSSSGNYNSGSSGGSIGGGRGGGNLQIKCQQTLDQIAAYQDGISKLDLQWESHRKTKNLYEYGIQENRKWYNSNCR